MKKATRKLITSLLIICLSFGLYPKMDISAASTFVGTDYTNYGITGGIVCYSTRERVKTYFASANVTYGKTLLLGTVTNTTGRKATMTGTYSKNRTRIYTISAKIPTSILKKAIDVTIGGSLSYSESVTLSASASVKKYSSHNFYYRVNTQVATYRHVVQKQQQNISGDWNNKGNAKTRYSYVTSTAPEIIV